MLDKYTDLIYEYSSLYKKELENRCVGRISIARAALKAFKNRKSIFALVFVFNWIKFFVIIFIFNLIRSPYDAFKFASKMESLAEGFKDYYFLLKHLLLKRNLTKRKRKRRIWTMSNAIELREEDLRSVLFSFEEALEKIGFLKEELPKIESKLKEILEDSKEMVTLDEFSKKNFKSICVEDVSYGLNACLCEAYFNISYFGGKLFE